MKKLLLALLMVFCLAGTAFAETLTFEWDQEIVDGFSGWRLYMAVDSSGGPYLPNPVAQIAYDGSGATHYTATETVETLMGTHTYYFVLVAFAGSESSSDSNEVFVELTKAVPTPLHFSVTISTE